MTCPNCGGTLVGDGYTSPIHCEFAECPDDRECDADPLYCNVEIYFQEGNLIGCAIGQGFIDPANSICGYGETEEEALDDLLEMLNK